MVHSADPVATINALLDRAAAGQITPDEMATLKEYALDARWMDTVMQGVKLRGLDQVGSEPLAPIGDYYVEKPGLYELRWPLPAHLPLPFASLDRKTQFFVLFGEWTRREMEGMEHLNRGDLVEATTIFDECLARAEQIDVAELRARSYEGLMRVAERAGQTAAAQELSQSATSARAPKR
jgi:hypothetical protein